MSDWCDCLKLPGQEHATDCWRSEMKRLREENVKLRAAMTTLVANHGSDGRFILSDPEDFDRLRKALDNL